MPGTHNWFTNLYRIIGISSGIASVFVEKLNFSNFTLSLFAEDYNLMERFLHFKIFSMNMISLSLTRHSAGAYSRWTQFHMDLFAVVLKWQEFVQTSTSAYPTYPCCMLMNTNFVDVAHKNQSHFEPHILPSKLSKSSCIHRLFCVCLCSSF